MDFEAYLISKKIDSKAFFSAEAQLWNSWKVEFEQIHPNSFTAQKLYLINPVRRKYPLKMEDIPKAIVKPELKVEVKTDESPTSAPAANPVAPAAKPVVPRPVFKPKPKLS